MILWFLLLLNAKTPAVSPKDHVEIFGEEMDCVEDTCVVTNAGKDVIAIYKGRHGHTHLTAKSITFSRKKTDTIDAKGGVNILHTPAEKEKSPIKMQADHCHYENKVLHFQGHVVIQQKENVVKGDRGEANLETHRIKVFGTKNKPASAVVVKDEPKTSEKK